MRRVEIANMARRGRRTTMNKKLEELRKRIAKLESKRSGDAKEETKPEPREEWKNNQDEDPRVQLLKILKGKGLHEWKFQIMMVV
jgi:hypothetical protein